MLMFCLFCKVLLQKGPGTGISLLKVEEEVHQAWTIVYLYCILSAIHVTSPLLQELRVQFDPS